MPVSHRKLSFLAEAGLHVVCTAALACIPAWAIGQVRNDMPLILSDEAVMADHPLPDFSHAGYEYGLGEIPNFSHVISVADHGAVPDDGKDDSAAILGALETAKKHDGPVRIQFDAGRYQLTEIVWIERSNIVLSGTGMGQGGTEIFMPRPLNQIDDGGALDDVRKFNESRYEVNKNLNLRTLFSEYSWSGGFIWTRAPEGKPAYYTDELGTPLQVTTDIVEGEQFSQTIEVADASNLRPGQVLKILWYNRAGENGPLIESLYGDADLVIGSRHWSSSTIPVVFQPTRIEAVSGNTVTIANPLLHPINEKLPANFSPWSHLANVGVEDIAFIFPQNPYFGHHNEAGYNAIYMTGVHNGWLRNIRVEQADSAIMSDDLANVTIRNIVIKGDHKGHYGVTVSRSHNVLVDGAQVFNDTHHSLSFNTLTTGSVFKDSIVWTNPSIDQHGGANHQNLVDNVTVYADPVRKARDGSPMIDIYNRGGGAAWHPGHGQFNTHWNTQVILQTGVPLDQHVTIRSMREGGAAPRIVGLHGNRPLKIDYPPNPYIERLDERVVAVPSLYDWQLAQRISN